TRPYGVDEVHSAVFAAGEMTGRPVVALLIPECEMQLCAIASDGEPVVFINRPPTNKDAKRWLRAACEQAIELGATFTLSCDTAEQAAYWAGHAAKLLPPRYERIALERMQDPATRCARGKLQ